MVRRKFPGRPCRDMHLDSATSVPRRYVLCNCALMYVQTSKETSILHR
jgi:hypothetical protein